MIKGPTSLPEKESQTRQIMKQYFKDHYSSAAQNALKLKEISLFNKNAQSEVDQGDEYFKVANYTLAANCYLNALDAPAYLCEGLFKLGLCIQEGADIKETGLAGLEMYQRHKGHTLSKTKLAAVFFREVIALAPNFKDDRYCLKPKSLDPHFSLAIYHLALCLSQGARLCAQDLINTPYAGYLLEAVPLKRLEMALYQRVLLLNPEHQDAQNRLHSLFNLYPVPLSLLATPLHETVSTPTPPVILHIGLAKLYISDDESSISPPTTPDVVSEIKSNRYF